MRNTLVGVVFALVSVHFAHAADQGVSGKKLLLRSSGRLVLISRDPGLSILGSNPTGGSDSSISFDRGDGPVTYALPRSLWTSNLPQTLYRYRNVAAPAGPSPVRAVKVRNGLLRVVSKAIPFPVPAGPASIDVRFDLDGGSNSYCMTFAAVGDGTRFVARDVPAATCPPLPTPTATPTATATPTETHTPALITVTFDSTGSEQTWQVPSWVTSIEVDVRGAQGGGNAVPDNGVGGFGGRVQTTLSVTPSEALYIYVGGRGGDLTPPNTAGPGGFNGGGDGAVDLDDFNGPSGGGGGASDIRQGGNTLADRVVVAGGGGGAECCTPAHGGGGGGVDGVAGGSVMGGASPGGGGSQTDGGAAGSPNASAGTLGQGGAGGSGNRAGGGGGGGLYGGGGGGGSTYGAGGGGGSGFPPSATHTSGFQMGDGQVLITYPSPP